MSALPRSLVALAALLFLSACQIEIDDDGEGGDEDAWPTLEYQVGQMLMVGFRGKSVTAQSPIVADIRERHVGGVVLYDYDVPSATHDRNIESPAQVRALVDDLQRVAGGELMVAVDQEGGYVNRLKPRYGFPETPSQAWYGEQGDPALTYRGALTTAGMLDRAGFTVNLAPVVDLDVNPDNPVIGAIDRSFGADPDRVVAQARAVIDGHRQTGVLTTLKHFPGHGSSTRDSHKGFVDVTHTWSRTELEPFARLIATGDADLVMTAHIYNQALDPDDPATLSRATIDGLLRGELGYDGVVISDDMQMGAITQYYGFEQAIGKAIDAGVDILVFANNSTFDPGVAGRAADAILGMVERGEIAPERIRASYRRICRLKNRHRSGEQRLPCPG